MLKFRDRVLLLYLILLFWVSISLVYRIDVAGDYSYFVRVWEGPEGGIKGFLLRFMASKDEMDQYIGVWTLIQLIESNGISSSLKSY